MSVPNLDDVQGDILGGFQKEWELYFFFKIDDVFFFRQNLRVLADSIASTTQVLADEAKLQEWKKKPYNKGLMPLSRVNFALSRAGLNTIGKKEDIGDSHFDGSNGSIGSMVKDAKALGDPVSALGRDLPDWDPKFLQPIDGLIIVTGESENSMKSKFEEVKKIFLTANKSQATMHEVVSYVGKVRQGDQRGHEHFGYLDGVSEPGVDKVTQALNPGQQSVPASTFVFPDSGSAPWRVNGSILAFRKLAQLVPEFDDFVNSKAASVKLRPELLGARLVGRWKHGASLSTNPDSDPGDKDGRNVALNDNFTDYGQGHTKCPFAAHTRKMNPRGDLGVSSINPRRILRRGIPFGDDVSKEESDAKKTSKERGLLFKCYQTNLDLGFFFLQTQWANAPNFPSSNAGIDPIIGVSTTTPKNMNITGVNPQGADLTLSANWVIPKAGEYFFSPSISVLRKIFGTEFNPNPAHHPPAPGDL